MSDKPAGNIKTALERFQSYCAAKGIPEKSSLAHIHKISQFEEHERKELRAAYEALKKENAEHKATISNLSKAYERESNDCLKQIEERDYWSDKADSLAYKISEVFDVPVGDHSNVNCPIDEANKILDGEYVTKFDKQVEALKAENEKLEAHFGGALDSIREHQQICNALKAENEAQAKRIAELEETNGLLQTQVHCLEMAFSKNGDSK